MKKIGHSIVSNVKQRINNKRLEGRVLMFKIHIWLCLGRGRMGHLGDSMYLFIFLCYLLLLSVAHRAILGPSFSQ